MNHQITLEEIEMILPTSEQLKKDFSTAVMPCFDCICNHCANCTECWDKCTGEMVEPCYVCEDCRNYDDGAGIYGDANVIGIKSRINMRREKEKRFGL